MEWQPNPNDLQILIDLLLQSTSPHYDTQNRIRIELEKFHAIPEYNNYLTYIFTCLELNTVVRNVAGLLLKNNIRNYFPKMPRNVQDYIKLKILRVLPDPQIQLRHTVGNITANLVKRSSYDEWKDLLPTLIQALDSNNELLVEGALYTIELLCEDTREKLAAEEYAFNILVPKLLALLKSPNTVYKKKAIISLSHFIDDLPGALILNMETYLTSIFALGGDPSADVRAHVCKTIVRMVYRKLDFLMPYIDEIIKYMLHASKDTSEEVALEACEFWAAIADAKKLCVDVLKNYLPTLIPILLNGMVYTESEIEGLDQSEDSMKPDRDQDIKPQRLFAQNTTKSFAGTGGNDENNVNGEMYNEQQSKNDDDDDDDDDYDDDDDFDGEYEDMWTIRKSCAYAIDKFSDIFEPEFYLSIMLPEIEKRTKPENDWTIKESAILALGAIADGIKQGLNRYLSNVVPFLINTLNDPKPLVRSITCWTLSRYSHWITSEGREQFLQNLVINLLNRILDNSKKVQEAACSAFATLEEETNDYELVPYLPNILQTFVSAFSKYQSKNLLILYDAISTLSRSVGSKLNKKEYIELLLPPFITKFNTIPDTNRLLLPLFGCLHQICSAIGTGLGNYIIIFYNRAIKILQDSIEAYHRHSQNPKDFDKPDSEFIVASLDLIQGLTEGIGAGIESLVSNSNLPMLLLQCMKVGGFDILQSSFALVGDLCKNCIVHMKPLMVEYLTVLSSYLNSETQTVCNNAIWSIGEICLRDPEQIKPFIPALVEHLIKIVNVLDLNRALLENTAVVLGRLGGLDPNYLSRHLDRYCKRWCLVMRRKFDDFEKDSAFRGLWLIINADPTAALKHLMYICDAIASWQKMDPALHEYYTKLLLMYKTAMAGVWNDFYLQFPAELREILDNKFFNPIQQQQQQQQQQQLS